MTVYTVTVRITGRNNSSDTVNLENEKMLKSASQKLEKATQLYEQTRQEAKKLKEVSIPITLCTTCYNISTVI